MNIKIKKITYLSLLFTVCLILSYLENLLFSGVLLPGVKLGLSNIPVVAALYAFGPPVALVIGVAKSFISLLIFGRLGSLLYSLLGIVFSVATMTAVKKTGAFSLLGVGISGSCAHIFGQLIAACVMLTSLQPLRLFPILCILSVVAAIVLYYPERAVLAFMKKSLRL